MLKLLKKLISSEPQKMVSVEEIHHEVDTAQDQAYLDPSLVNEKFN